MDNIGKLTSDFLDGLTGLFEIKEVRVEYFVWISQICKLMNEPLSYGPTLILDPNWIICWLQEMTPQEAFTQYQKHIASQN